MKKVLTALIAGLTLLVMTGLAQASLTTIGTASYGGTNYNLIYDDDDTGYGGGGLVWLDYTHSEDLWLNQVNWASGLGSSLTVTLKPGYTTDINWTTGWRLPDTVDGPYVSGYEGDPDNDGVYTYTAGHNLANSEIGHLFYTELGNLGRVATDGTWPQPGHGLTNTGDFENLREYDYRSGTEYAVNPDLAWEFYMGSGFLCPYPKYNVPFTGALAVHSGNVVPLPGAVWLFGSGLVGLATLMRRKPKSSM